MIPVVLNPFSVNQKLFSGSQRFSLCPLTDVMLKKDLAMLRTNESKYIIAVGVGHSPDHWTGSKYSEVYHINDYTNENIPNLFDLINDKHLADLQQGNALLLIDQSHEGYHRPWIWKWFHEECKRLNINPKAVVFVVGDHKASDEYKTWCLTHFQFNKIKVIQATTLKSLVLDRNSFKTDFSVNINYKLSNKISTYDCINKHQRLHRIYNFLHLYKNDLIADGLISMDKITRDIPADEYSKYGLSEEIKDQAQEQLPLWIDNTPNYGKEFIHYESRVLKNMYKNSWVSVVTEASYFDYENSIFISEKIFKPMLCMQPFIVVGPKGYLKKLRTLGYHTFPGWIDEKYDNCSDTERFEAVVCAIKKIKAIPNKLEWLYSMRSVLEHNYKLITSLKNKPGKEELELYSYYKDYFNV